eukprot:727102_1
MKPFPLILTCAAILCMLRWHHESTSITLTSVLDDEEHLVVDHVPFVAKPYRIVTSASGLESAFHLSRAMSVGGRITRFMEFRVADSLILHATVTRVLFMAEVPVEMDPIHEERTAMKRMETYVPQSADDNDGVEALFPIWCERTHDQAHHIQSILTLKETSNPKRTPSSPKHVSRSSSNLASERALLSTINTPFETGNSLHFIPESISHMSYKFSKNVSRPPFGMHRPKDLFNM